ncbi:MAG: P-loop NTPase, partial [Chloroflexi bacterium]|nr:P-loop NTPase [Chloroflexota bacterium]
MTGKTIVITSGKGGVGKTTATANIGTGLAMRGHNVVVIDTDIGLRNLDVVMGLENRIVYDLVQVIEEVCQPQQAMIREIFLKIHSDEYRDKVMHQFLSDNSRGKKITEEAAFASYAGGDFGEPGKGDFEFVFTGRHCTRRCDGNSVAGTAFGGPIFYGHAAGGFNEGPEHKGNVYWYQAKRANAVFQMLDGKQRAKALMDTGRKEQKSKTVELTGKTTGLDGLSVSDMSADQKAEMRKVLADFLLPFRKEDREEAMKLIEPQFEH